jgi:Fur family ferric uptake transcriptional regulator|tara:strand:- start:121 stop:531 length:411 start_codon:yes stop_codon:yes gene_type:complete
MDDLFIKYGLKKTSFRKELLIFFQSSSSSLTVKKIIKKFASSVDKVSIYRALNSFEKSGLIHKVPDKNNLLRYSLCSSECGPGKHSHDHAHLLCSICDETFCLDDFLLPNIKSHNGYVINNYKIILEGSCLSCQGK